MTAETKESASIKLGDHRDITPAIPLGEILAGAP
jgi:hypothetical protein